MVVAVCATIRMIFAAVPAYRLRATLVARLRRRPSSHRRAAAPAGHPSRAAGRAMKPRRGRGISAHDRRRGATPRRPYWSRRAQHRSTATDQARDSGVRRVSASLPASGVRPCSLPWIRLANGATSSSRRLPAQLRGDTGVIRDPIQSADAAVANLEQVSAPSLCRPGRFPRLLVTEDHVRRKVPDVVLGPLNALEDVP
jgi:hypothetical protein